MLNSSLMTEKFQEDVARKRLQSIISNVLGQKKKSQWETVGHKNRPSEGLFDEAEKYSDPH